MQARPSPPKPPVSRSHNSFAGSDIKAVIGQFQFAELQAISYAITREKAPIYTMGSADPRAYSRNKRGIAGNLIWINFDRHALLNLFHKARGRYVADVDEIRPQFSMDAPDANALFQSSIVRRNGLSIGETIDKLDTQVSDIYGLHELAAPVYSDQVMPFDITLAGANEYGAMCSAKILSVEILNEPGLSVLPEVKALARTRGPSHCLRSQLGRRRGPVFQSASVFAGWRGGKHMVSDLAPALSATFVTGEACFFRT